MGRGFLMALLALDLLVMGASGYVLWDRVKKNASPPPAPIVVQPPMPAPAPEPAAKLPGEKPEDSGLEEAAPEPTAKAKSRKHEGKPKKISFHYRDPSAKRVSIVGEFNQWSPQLMKKDAEQRWGITLNLKPGEYAYNFMVDGKLIRDPAQKKSTKRPGQKIPASVLQVKG